MNNLLILSPMTLIIHEALTKEGFKSVALRNMTMASNCASYVHPCIRYDVDIASLHTELDHHQLIFKSTTKKRQKA
jgi:putative NIF3 family GTP cyclohydrolase 1 type 2